MNFLEELKWRHLVKDVMDEEALLERMKQPMTIYCGFDPTADSLHVGHLQQLILLKRYQNEGHHPIALIGGATGMIGDPSGKSAERSLLSFEEVDHNVKSIKVQIERLLSEPVTVLDNKEWLGQVNLLEFLRDTGKFFSINTMLAKETISSRLDTGISYTEFSYTILQAMDWLHLLENHNCQVQIGGSDQWGNLISGADLIRKKHGDQVNVYGITSPLITKSDGTKFGKSEGGNVWINPELTDAYTFYQFWINTSDADIEDFMKRLSLKSVEEIQSILHEHQQAPEKRLAQKALAQELTQMIHKQEGLENALMITDALFNNDVFSLNSEQLKVAFSNAAKIEISQDELLADVLVNHQLIKSKREVRQLITQNALELNGQKVTEFDQRLSKGDAIDQRLSIVKKGKKNYYLIEHN